MASSEEKQMLQFFLHKPLVSVKELQKAFSIIYKSIFLMEHGVVMHSTINFLL